MFASRSPGQRLENSANSSAVERPSGKIMSAPASRYAIPLRIASSRSTTERASVLAMIRKSPWPFAETAALMFSTIRSVVTSFLPSRCPHRFGKTWSSRCIPAAPARSYSCTARTIISSSPYPVSASATTGSPLASHTSRIVRQTSVNVSMPTSGTPAAFAVAPPEM